MWTEILIGLSFVLVIEGRITSYNVCYTKLLRKHEVRFRDSRRVHDVVFGTLSRLLRDIRPGEVGLGVATPRAAGGIAPLQAMMPLTEQRLVSAPVV